MFFKKMYVVFGKSQGKAKQNKTMSQEESKRTLQVYTTFYMRFISTSNDLYWRKPQWKDLK